MNTIAYGLVAGLLALFSLYAGTLKIVRSRDQLRPMMAWVDRECGAAGWPTEGVRVTVTPCGAPVEGDGTRRLVPPACGARFETWQRIDQVLALEMARRIGRWRPIRRSAAPLRGQ
ncbi:hypothetical protein PUR71_07875 [Streptomyces sp. SP17BM10]|uniref:hypothetical protein n=1 Tax=Streptomyces sp. SP17BM10 TaxID=3002530 RepID=UPI002E7A21AF|nr:hypothetical protein [Streptomyces sp. SP17BM10]MEE1782832.1 hypothetical protein [Streptomyces sp. SP17BM10]